MSNQTKLIFLLVTAIVLSKFSISSGEFVANDGGRDSPVILTPSDNSIRIDTVRAFPWPDTVSVPVLFEAAQTDSICQFEFELTYPNSDLAFAGYSLDTLGWGGDIVIYDDPPNLEVQGFNDLLTGSTSYVLANLKFAVAESVGFEQTMNLNFRPDVYFQKCGSSESYDPIEIDGWVQTYSDSFWIDIANSIKGYSYQALDTSSIYKRNRFVEVPIYMFAAFPCSEFKFWVHYRLNSADSGLIFAGYDTASALYGATAAIEPTNPTLIRIDNTADPQIFDRQMSFTPIKLRFRVGDFHEEYNDTCTFDSVLVISAYQNANDYLKGADSDYEFHPDSASFFDGSVNLGVYSLWSVINDGQIAPDSTVILPVKMKTQFWGQYYKLFICYNHFELQLDTITAATADSVPRNISYGFEDTSGGIYTIWVEVDTLRDYEFIRPNPFKFYTLFNLKFTLADSLDPGDSSEVYFQTTSEICQVWDYFPPEYDTSHVKRYSTDCSGCFNDSSGFVKMPAAMVSADDDVPCENDSAAVPVRILWIDIDRVPTEIRISAMTKGPLLYRGIIEDTTDFNIDWGIPDIRDGGQSIVIEGTCPKYEIDGPGVLLELAMAAHAPEYDKTIVTLQEVRFGHDGTYWYADLDDGSVIPCERLRSEDMVIPTVPGRPFLAQNNPNPFNSTTSIEFQVPSDQQVTIDIYDILGRKVRRLLSEHFTAGKHKVIWNCTNEAGEEVTTGFYIYIFSTDDYRQSKKMLMLK